MHVNLVDLVKSFPTNILLQNLTSIQLRTSPIRFAHLAEKSEKCSISNLSTKVELAREDATAQAEASALPARLKAGVEGLEDAQIDDVQSILTRAAGQEPSEIAAPGVEGVGASPPSPSPTNTEHAYEHTQVSRARWTGLEHVYQLEMDACGHVQKKTRQVIFHMF